MGNAFKSCRSKKADDEKNLKKNVEPPSQPDSPPLGPQRNYAVDSDGDRSDRLQTCSSGSLNNENCLPECDQQTNGTSIAVQPLPAEGAPRLDKEAMIQMYAISQPPTDKRFKEKKGPYLDVVKEFKKKQELKRLSAEEHPVEKERERDLWCQREELSATRKGRELYAQKADGKKAAQQEPVMVQPVSSKRSFKDDRDSSSKRSSRTETESSRRSSKADGEEESAILIKTPQRCNYNKYIASLRLADGKTETTSDENELSSSRRASDAIEEEIVARRTLTVNTQAPVQRTIDNSALGLISENKPKKFIMVPPDQPKKFIMVPPDQPKKFIMVPPDLVVSSKKPADPPLLKPKPWQEEIASARAIPTRSPSGRLTLGERIRDVIVQKQPEQPVLISEDRQRTPSPSYPIQASGQYNPLDDDEDFKRLELEIEQMQFFPEPEKKRASREVENPLFGGNYPKEQISPDLEQRPVGEYFLGDGSFLGVKKKKVPPPVPPKPGPPPVAPKPKHSYTQTRTIQQADAEISTDTAQRTWAPASDKASTAEDGSDTGRAFRSLESASKEDVTILGYTRLEDASMVEDTALTTNTNTTNTQEPRIVEDTALARSTQEPRIVEDASLLSLSLKDQEHLTSDSDPNNCTRNTSSCIVEANTVLNIGVAEKTGPECLPLSEGTDNSCSKPCTEEDCLQDNNVCTVNDARTRSENDTEATEHVFPTTQPASENISECEGSDTTVSVSTKDRINTSDSVQNNISGISNEKDIDTSSDNVQNISSCISNERDCASVSDSSAAATSEEQNRTDGVSDIGKSYDNNKYEVRIQSGGCECDRTCTEQEEETCKSNNAVTSTSAPQKCSEEHSKEVGKVTSKQEESEKDEAEVCQKQSDTTTLEIESEKGEAEARQKQSDTMTLEIESEKGETEARQKKSDMTTLRIESEKDEAEAIQKNFDMTTLETESEKVEAEARQKQSDTPTLKAESEKGVAPTLTHQGQSENQSESLTPQKESDSVVTPAPTQSVESDSANESWQANGPETWDRQGEAISLFSEDKRRQVLPGEAQDDVKGSNTSVVQSGGEEQVPERVRKLEQRQEKVLAELNKLQQSLESLAMKRGVNLAAAAASASSSATSNVGAAATASSEPSPLQPGKLHDLVISADPASTPLSLLVLLKQLSSQCQVLTTTFVHSSATDTPQKLRTFMQNGVASAPRSSYQLAVSIVWKKLPNGSPRLMVSPTRQTYIEGESNIARYLSRLMTPAYDSNNIATTTLIDDILDLVQQQVLQGNSKERAGAMRTLNARLGKAQWLVGGTLSLADMVAWSALSSTGLAGEAPANVKKWLKACAESEVFRSAVDFVAS